VAPRFYLFALKGYAYLSLRLGEAEEGAAVLALLEQLDPTDSLGHRVLGAVLARAGRDVDYDEPVETAP
jgi:Flp pilus assembly protein TadD